MISLLVVAAVSFLLSLALMPIGRIVALRLGLVDRPDGHRKIHSTATPLSGGSVIFLSSVMAVGTALFLPFGDGTMLAEHGRVLLGLLAGGLIIHAIGVADDFGLVRGRHKLVGQIVAVSVVIGFSDWVHTIQLFGMDLELGWFGIPFTMFLMLGAINSLNLIDGMDGLLGSVGVILSLALAIMAMLASHGWAAAVALALAGSLLGFLRYNLPPASVFMGDSGSMLVGLVLGTLAIHCSLKAPTTMALAMPVALLVLPILDTTAAIIRRKLTGRSIYTTDRGHLHHCLLRFGLSTRLALGVAGICCLVACAGVLASQAFKNDWIAIVTAIAIIVTLVATRLFGHAETMLIKGRLMSLLMPRGRARHMEVRLQGSVDWRDLWQRLKILAADLNLQQMLLDVNAPILHEGYHARWSRAATDLEERPGWYVEIPMTAHGHSVGRLVMSGKPDQQPFWDKIELVMRVVDDFNHPAPVVNTVEVREPRSTMKTTNLETAAGHLMANVHAGVAVEAL